MLTYLFTIRLYTKSSLIYVILKLRTIFKSIVYELLYEPLFTNSFDLIEVKEFSPLLAQTLSLLPAIGLPHMSP